MRVLHVINSLSTGGAEKLLLDTIPVFNKKGIKVDILVIDGTIHPYLARLKELSCCDIYSLKTKSVYNPINIFKIIPFLRNYEILHVHLFPSLYWVALAKVISISKTKLVFTEHSTSNRRIESAFFNILDRFIYNRFSKIICISKEIKTLVFETYRLTENKLVFIENGIDLNIFSNAEPLERRKIRSDIGESDKLLIQVAGFRYQKDQKTTIKALCHLPVDFKLILVGDGENREYLEKLVQELNLQNRVIFLGVRMDVPSLMKTSDIIIVSSHWEGMPLSVIEGMAVGKPVVASNVPGISQLINGVGILFEQGNEIELAAKIFELFSDSDYYQSFAKAGHTASLKFDIEVMIKKQISLYKEILS